MNKNIAKYNETSGASYCISTVLKHYGANVSLTKIKELCNDTETETSTERVVMAVRRLGYWANSVKVENYDSIFTNPPLPLIAHIKIDNSQERYIVVQSITEEGIVVEDYSSNSARLSHDVFQKIWTGFFILLKPPARTAVEHSTKLIVNADDFGFTNGINQGVIKAYKDGIVTSASLMVNMPFSMQAAKLALENPGLGVGIHFVLTAGTPVSSDIHTLLDENGDFLRPKAFVKAEPNPIEIEKELRAQLNKFLSFGLTPSHFDSHHHIHMIEFIYPIVEKLAMENKVAMRNLFANKFNETLKTDICINGFYGDDISIEQLKRLLRDSVFYKTSELICHPGFVDDQLRNVDSYCDLREKELSILISPEIKRILKKLDIELVNYNQL